MNSQVQSEQEYRMQKKSVPWYMVGMTFYGYSIPYSVMILVLLLIIIIIYYMWDNPRELYKIPGIENLTSSEPVSTTPPEIANVLDQSSTK